MAETCRHHLNNEIRSYDSCVLMDPPTLNYTSQFYKKLSSIFNFGYNLTHIA